MLERLSSEAQEQRRIYKKQYRLKNREKINSQQRAWRANNTELVRQYNERYWERRAEKAKNHRASWEDDSPAESSLQKGI